jgi:DNA repair protein RecN (Recombination protein N)
MLTELRIENFAIIDHLEVSFAPGLVTFTGETGAGKSIIIDALEALLGGRTDASMVRSSAQRASVEGVFHLPAEVQPPVQSILEREELLDDPQYLTLSREIRSNGRSVARVNGRSASAGLLRELGEYLVDVHGQSEHLSLLRVSQHLELLDRYASAASPGGPDSLDHFLDEYSRSFQRLRQVRQELQELRSLERDTARRADMLEFQIKEIEAARLHPGEEETLREERNRLANAESLASLAQQAIQVLDEGAPETPALTDMVGQLTSAMHSLARLDPAQAQMEEQAIAISEGLAEMGRSLQDYLEGIEFNPRRLDQVEERLALIHTLKRKYGESIKEVLDFAVQARQQREAITHASERIEALEVEQQDLQAALGKLGLNLSERRQASARLLASAIEAELSDLKMTGAQFQVDFQQIPDPEGLPLPDGRRVTGFPNGIERIEFLIAPNPGEGFKPLARIASGGETSRLMLALKNVLAKADRIPTLVFDEIDQGIGGRVGSVVGYKLWSLGSRHQVLCITHLPQLAAFGQQHFHVYKQVEAGRTSTVVRPLAGQERVVELAQMLGEVSEGTLRSAQEILDAASRQVNQ